MWAVFLFCFVLNKFIYLFIFGCVGSLLLSAGFLQLRRVGATLLRRAGFSLRWLLFVAEHGFQARRLQQLWLTGSRAQTQKLWRTGLVAPPHVGSCRTRTRTRFPCIGRRILNHCATREVPVGSFEASFLHIQMSPERSIKTHSPFTQLSSYPQKIVCKIPSKSLKTLLQEAVPKLMSRKNALT